MKAVGQSSLIIGEDRTYALDYNADEQVTWAAVRTAKTVDLLEVKMYFDDFMAKDYLLQKDYENQSNLQLYNQANAEQRFAGLGT